MQTMDMALQSLVSRGIVVKEEGPNQEHESQSLWLNDPRNRCRGALETRTPMDIYDLCREMVDKKASDLYLTVARPPTFRIDGSFETATSEAFKPQDLEELAKSFTTELQWSEFLEKRELNVAISVPNISRFRVNVFRQRGSVGMVIRRINVEIPRVEELGLPAILKDIVLLKRGLVLVVGSTGSGKSTTLRP